MSYACAINLRSLRLWLFLTAAIALTPLSASASEHLFYKEVNLIGGYASDTGTWPGKSGMLKNSLGFEDYRKFSNDYGDFLTTDLQLRISYDSLESSDDAWAAEIHNAWLEYKPGLGKKVRLGHFDVPFGLEPLLDTHATILQTLADKNIGFKKDWGIAFEGTGQSFDFETALQLGSGMSIYRRDGSFLLSSRLGIPAGDSFQWGISGLYGKTLETMGMRTFPRSELVSDAAALKKRIGLDAQYSLGPYAFKSEASFGTDEHNNVLGHLWQVDYTVPNHQNWQLGAQYRTWIHDTARNASADSLISAGVTYKLNNDVTLRAFVEHDLNLNAGGEDDRILFQVYYFAL